MVKSNWHDEHSEVADARHGHIRFFSNDVVIGSSLRFYGEWAENELRFFNHFIQPGATVIDIGAFIGTHTLAFSKMVGAQGRVIAVEPQPQTFRLLEENVAVNAPKNVRLFNAVAGCVSGEVRLSPLKLAENTNFGGFSVCDEAKKDNTEGSDVAVEAITIDSMALQRCDFIKIDVEGAEADVLLGSIETINKFSPVIYMECNSIEAGSCCVSAIKKIGYCIIAHAVDAFNPNNFFKSKQDIFGGAREVALIAVAPNLKNAILKLSDPSWRLFEINTLDDLSYVLLQKPQYFDEVLRAGAAAKCGGIVVQMTDYSALQDALEEKSTYLEKAQAELNAAQAELNVAQAARARAETNIAQLTDERNQLLRYSDREARRPWRPLKRYAAYLLLKSLSFGARPFSEPAADRFKRSAAKRSPRRFRRLFADAGVNWPQTAAPRHRDIFWRRDQGQTPIGGSAVRKQSTIQLSDRRPAAVTRSTPLDDTRKEWLTYAPMASRIAEERGRRLQEAMPAPVPFVSLGEGDLAEVAAKLEFVHEERPIVSIVVPVFNNIKFTMECLQSIYTYTDSRTPFEIIIADDASTDENSAILSRIRNLVYVRNQNNLGFILNCNGAARRARGEFLLFLNSDVQVSKNWLVELVDVFAKSDKIGAAGPRIVFPSGHLQEAGALVNADCSTQLIGLGDDPSYMRYAFARRVDYCSGACLMVRRKVFEQIGGFNEALCPAYCEDLDLCLKLRELGLETWYTPQSIVLHHLSKSSDLLGNDYKMRNIVTNRQKIAENWQRDIDAMNRVRVFAFYLPQFHPIRENDQWWGRGFTEWSNVSRALPMYEGHSQPRLPTELGFYDLRRPETLADQAALARRYGIEAFCFYYYWFGGKRLLETPLETMLASGKPDFPFLLCWANENWTRRWDGRDTEILISQRHSDQDDAAVIRDLMRYFRDPRYARVNGRPILLVYRVGLFPNFARTAATWRKLCQAEGIGEIYLATVASFDKAGDSQPPESFGCDAVVQFPPHGAGVPTTLPAGLRPDFSGTLFDYEESALKYLRQPLPAGPFFPGVMPSWDNTPRRMNQATIFTDSSPGAFQAWLEEAIRSTCEHNTGDERIVFVNAWNEWAEGAHIEPDSQLGHANLEAIRNALLAHNLRAE